MREMTVSSEIDDLKTVTGCVKEMEFADTCLLYTSDVYKRQSHHYDVGSVKEQLQHARRHQRQCEHEYRRQQRSAAHIDLGS